MKKWPKIGRLSDTIIWYNKHKDKFSLPDELTFEGTVKLHGTNAGIRFDTNTCKITSQSRSNVLSLTKDNYGFHQFLKTTLANEDGADFLANLFDLLISTTGEESVTVFGEWIGSGIQHGVGISNLEKRIFVIFGMIAGDGGVPEPLPVFVENRELGMYNILSVEQTYLTVDMTDPEDLQRFSEEIEKATLEYEESCPYTAFLYKAGEIKEVPECKTGEGLVWTCVDRPEFSELTFKSKGDKHQGNKKNKFKTIAPLEAQVLKDIEEFIEFTLTEGRLKQGLENVPELSIKYTGDYIKWIVNDVVEENTVEFLNLGVDWKPVKKRLAGTASKYFLEAVQAI